MLLFLFTFGPTFGHTLGPLGRSVDHVSVTQSIVIHMCVFLCVLVLARIRVKQPSRNSITPKRHADMVYLSMTALMTRAIYAYGPGLLRTSTCVTVSNRVCRPPGPDDICTVEPVLGGLEHYIGRTFRFMSGFAVPSAKF